MESQIHGNIRKISKILQINLKMLSQSQLLSKVSNFFLNSFQFKSKLNDRKKNDK